LKIIGISHVYTTFWPKSQAPPQGGALICNCAWGWIFHTVNQNRPDMDLVPEHEKQPQNNGSPQNDVSQHRVEAKAYVFLALWIFADFW
jgi:hypothetical protein